MRIPVLASALALGFVFKAALTVMPMAFAASLADDALARLEQALARNDSATEVLAAWCRARGMPAAPAIRAVPVVGEPVVPSPDLRELLDVPRNQALGFRHVRLMCGDAVLSQARNWYVPSRLTPAMNHLLTTGDHPFGTVIARLGFHRERLESRRGAGAGCPGRTILTNRALIRARDGEPLALVVECYQPALITAPA